MKESQEIGSLFCFILPLGQLTIYRMKKMTWHILLSYDANTSFYVPIKEGLDFKSIQAVENQRFRVILLILLIDGGARDIESYVASTVAFDLTLDENINPINHIKSILDDSLGDAEPFGYMVQSTVEAKDWPVYDYSPIDSEHIIGFGKDYRQALRLYSMIKTQDASDQ